MKDLEARYEVVVIGGGNAGLSAAISAAEHGARVCLLEKASQELRGGNTYFTGDFRFGWESFEDDILPLIPGISAGEINEMKEQVSSYSNEQFYEDVMRVTEGFTDPDLLRLLVTESLPAIKWLRAMGQEWIPSYHEPGASMVVKLNGGGARLSDQGFKVAAAKGVEIRYQNVARELLLDSRGKVVGVYALTPEGFTRIHAQAVILACGGFEANAGMRASFLGDGWDRVKIRGVPFNTGDGLRMAWDIGAQSYGNLNGCHAAPQAMDRPAFSVRVQPPLEYRRYGYPWSVMVNAHGQRFIDEGSDKRAYTYAKTGAAIMKQPHGVAFQICDKKMEPLLKGYYSVTGAKANTLEQLAQMLGLEPGPFVNTIQEYNKAVQSGEFNPRILDGKRTIGLAINKSNWATTIDTPPFVGGGVCCAITFTYGGLRINTQTEVMNTSEAAIPGLYACGEIIGGLWYVNYPGGSGMTQGTAFGRIAGRNAAALAKGHG
jgi:tricarballylate dehydrogenase